MKDIVYEYDGSFDGFLCCVYESYTQKENPTGFFVGEADCTLFDTRYIPTVAAHAKRVYRSFFKTSQVFGPLLQRAWLTILPEKELQLFALIRLFYRLGPVALQDLSHETVSAVRRAVRHLEEEAQQLRGFVRFSEFGGVLGAEIEPKNRVLPLLRGHFCGRYREESFFIYDRTHREALFYAAHQSRIVPLEQFQMNAPGEEEAAYRVLWKRFYDTISIRERENPRGRMSKMPKRYWGTMTEFQSEDFFVSPCAAGILHSTVTPSADEAFPAPSAPDGIPAPETPPVCGHTAPV
ncbi:MAG: TIGR03915 family putative DNA repair protein [Oscillospiraceae bacterium]|nr:TIGR03915 family putative DNA repair protein [Oscillospiraceae bacterium]